MSSGIEGKSILRKSCFGWDAVIASCPEGAEVLSRGRKPPAAGLCHSAQAPEGRQGRCRHGDVPVAPLGLG